MKEKRMNTLLEEARRTAELMNTRITLCIPSVLAEGEKFSARISITDASGLPVESFKGSLVFKTSPGVSGLPGIFRFPGGEMSSRIDGLEAAGGDAAVILAAVEVPGAGKDYLIASNPAWIFNDRQVR